MREGIIVIMLIYLFSLLDVLSTYLPKEVVELAKCGETIGIARGSWRQILH